MGGKSQLTARRIFSSCIFLCLRDGFTSTTKSGLTFFLYCSLCLLPFMCISFAFGSLKRHSHNLQLKLITCNKYVYTLNIQFDSLYSSSNLLFRLRFWFPQCSPDQLAGCPARVCPQCPPLSCRRYLRAGPDLLIVQSLSLVSRRRTYGHLRQLPAPVTVSVCRAWCATGRPSDVWRHGCERRKRRFLSKSKQSTHICTSSLTARFTCACNIT